VIARSPTTQRIAGSWHSLSASFYVFVASKPSEHRLAQQAGQPMATILAGARIGELVTGRVGQAQRVIPARDRAATRRRR
jgi:hypothetical protein